MSVPKDSRAVSWLFREVSKLYINLLERGVLIRGGMTIGDISTDPEAPWGPAVVEACHIESTIAEYPRIAFSKSALEYAQTEMDRKEEDHLIARGDDGVWALSPFVWGLKTLRNGQAMLTRKSGKKIKDQLESAHKNIVSSPKIFRKIDWLVYEWDEKVWEVCYENDWGIRTDIGLKRSVTDAFGKTLIRWKS